MSSLNYFSAANYPAATVNPFTQPAGLVSSPGMTWVCVRQFGLNVFSGTDDFRFAPGDWVEVSMHRVNELRAEQMIY